MPGGPARETIRDLGILFRFGITGDLTDGQLLDRFVGERDEGAEEAFAILVRRHGPMVLGVCRRVLRSAHEAEDAFQSTFLVLARKAATIARRETVANWLYGVALRTAKDARVRTRRRRLWEERAGALRVVSPPAADPEEEFRAILDEELSRLPARLRAPLLLCELESLSRHQAAHRLGIPEGTLSSRLARAKTLLRERLTRRGLGLTAAWITTFLAREAESAMVPHALAEFTTRAGTLLAAGHSLFGLVALPVYSLTTEVLRAMLFTKIKGIAIGLFLVGSAVTGAMVLAQVPKGADDPLATTTSGDVVKSARPSDSAKMPDGFITKQAAGSYFRDRSDSDRLHAVEQKLDRILEALGRTGSSGSSSNSARPDPRVAAEAFSITATTPSADVAPAATKDYSVRETRTAGSRVEARFALTTDRLRAVELRLAEFERRMADLERRLNQHWPSTGSHGVLAPRSADEPSTDALPKM